MSASKKTSDLLNSANVVATIPTPAALELALKLEPGAVDLFELRVDHFAADPATLLRAAPMLSAPLIVTVRHPDEGGQGKLTLAQRRALFAEFMPVAAFIDIELRSMRPLARTIDAARAAGVKLIASAHFFDATPPSGRLARIRSSAVAAGADVCKIAARADRLSDLSRLFALLDGPQPLPLSVMGMGPFGKISRLLLARAGSVLNYGYLDEANASGQWPAVQLKTRLDEL